MILKMLNLLHPPLPLLLANKRYLRCHRTH